MEQDKEKEEHKIQKEVEHKKRIVLSKSFYTKVYVVLGIALVLFGLHNNLQIYAFRTIFEQKLVEVKEAARPAEIELIVITTNNCEDCYNINAVVDVVESTGVNITKKEEIDFSSEEARSIIDKYGIEKVPTVIVTGEISKSRSLTSKLKDIGEEKQSAYIFTKLEPPFIETSSGKVRGKVSLVHLKKSDCSNCFNLTAFVDQLEKAGVKFAKKIVLDVDSSEGSNIINKYNIKKIPSLVMDKEAEVYTNIIQIWNQLGSIEKDGSFVIREINPPYYNVEEKSVKGFVSMIVLVDKSCKDCYDPDRFHKPILQRMGVVFKDENRIDISSQAGKELLDKYNIEKIPTIVLKGDVEEYPVLVRAWVDVGTVESDKTYVFRKVEVARQKYMDLTKKEVVDPLATD